LNNKVENNDSNLEDNINYYTIDKTEITEDDIFTHTNNPNIIYPEDSKWDFFISNGVRISKFFNWDKDSNSALLDYFIDSINYTEKLFGTTIGDYILRDYEGKESYLSELNNKPCMILSMSTTCEACKSLNPERFNIDMDYFNFIIIVTDGAEEVFNTLESLGWDKSKIYYVVGNLKSDLILESMATPQLTFVSGDNKIRICFENIFYDSDDYNMILDCLSSDFYPIYTELENRQRGFVTY